MTHDPREALEPFARIPLSHTDDIDDSATVFKYEGGAITLGDLRRVHAALTAPPAAAESNASVEARLREAVLVSIDMIENCAGVPTNPDSLPQMVKVYLQQTISAVGDEAKKSEGGPLNWQLSDDAQARIAEIESHIVHPGDPRLATVIGGGSAFCGHNVMKSLCLECTPGQAPPSSPTAERREIVARWIYEHQPIDARSDEIGDEIPWSALAEFLKAVHYAEADELLAALDGGR